MGQLHMTEDPVLFKQVVVHSAYHGKEQDTPYLRVNEVYTIQVGEGMAAVLTMDRKTKVPMRMKYFPLHAIQDIDCQVDDEYAKQFEPEVAEEK